MVDDYGWVKQSGVRGMRHHQLKFTEGFRNINTPVVVGHFAPLLQMKSCIVWFSLFKIIILIEEYIHIKCTSVVAPIGNTVKKQTYSLIINWTDMITAEMLGLFQQTTCHLLLT